MFLDTVRSRRASESSDRQTMVEDCCVSSFRFCVFSIFCNRSIRRVNDVDECLEAECRMKLFEQVNDEIISSKDVFNFNVHLTDHTGSIGNVKLGDDVARKMLKCSVSGHDTCDNRSSTIDCHSNDKQGR
jgi:hypothetical protein